MIKGYINSIQTLGTLDGPGVRFVVFTQGCNLRCHCCHNPETWEYNVGDTFSPDEIVKKAEGYRSYFGDKGGITFSGGEPLLQPEFVFETFKLCKEKGINTCIDTSGSIINDDVKKMLSVTDRVLLDIKYTDEESYKKYVGCSFAKIIEFLDLLQENNIPTTIRQVVIPTKNDTDENFKKLKSIVDSHSCVDKVELLPFKKICVTKYEASEKKFPFEDVRTPTHDEMLKFQRYFN